MRSINNLKEIDLSNKKVSVSEIEILKDSIIESNQLITLKLKNCQLRPDHFIHLKEAIIHNRSLIHLDLRDNLIVNLSLRYLTEALAENLTILELYLPEKNIAPFQEFIKNYSNNYLKIKSDLFTFTPLSEPIAQIIADYLQRPASSMQAIEYSQVENKDKNIERD